MSQITRKGRYSKKFSCLKRASVRFMAAVVLLSVLFLSSALAEKEFRPLPIDLSGGAPLGVTFSNRTLIYEDPTIRVERFPPTHDPKTLQQYYAVDIQIKHPSQLRTASADPGSFTSSRVVQPERIAARVNAVFALNGDYSSDDSIENKKYVMRQGLVFRGTVEPSLDMLLIDEEGDLHIVPCGPELEAMDKKHIDGKEVWNVFQFGPGLVINGEPVADEYILDEKHSPKYAVPDKGALRICLVQVGKLHYKAICTRYHANLQVFRDLILSVAPDCINAYVLDGGGSAQLIFLGKTLNPASKDPRKLSDIIYFASAWFDEDQVY